MLHWKKKLKQNTEKQKNKKEKIYVNQYSDDVL